MQDLHGYDNPWPAGGGKNKACDIFSEYTKPDNYYILPVDLSASSSWRLSSTLVGTKVTGFAFGIVKDGDRYSNFVNQINTVNSDGDCINLQINVDSSWVSPKLVCYCSGETGFNQIFANYHIQLEAGTDITSWTPYSNICPISGWTGAEVVAAGRNLWDEVWEVGSYSNTGAKVETQGGRIRSVNKFPVKPSTTYYMSGGVYLLCQYDSNGDFVSFTQLGIDGSGNPAHTVTVSDKTHYVSFATYQQYGSTYNHDIFINYPSTDTDYHAYTGSDYSIEFPQSAGTVYGGNLHVNEDGSGTLVVDKVGVDSGTLDWVRNTSGTYPVFRASIGSAPIMSYGYTVLTSARYVVIPNISAAGFRNNDYNGKTTINSSSSPSAIEVMVQDSAFTDATAFKTALSGETLVYRLATPRTYTLTAPQIALLLGENNIWADTGDTAVEYIADTKLYIQTLTGHPDEDMIADSNITSGSFFMVGNTLYIATTNIASGSTVIPGTNCTKMSLAAALNSINA